MSSVSERASSHVLWNHNVQFHPWILRNMPTPCESALDVGCGDGVLTPKLAQRSSHATGIDVSPEMVAIAREASGGSNLTYVAGDVMSYPLPEQAFDFIAAVAVIHHLPLDAALRRVAALLRPRGVLAVVGLARNQSLADYALSVASIPVTRLWRVRRGWRGSPAPRVEPSMTYAEIKSTATALLPGAVIRRRLFFRYTLLWRKP